MATESFNPLFDDDGDWPALNPKPIDTRFNPTIPAGSVTNDKLAGGISPLKLQGVGIQVQLGSPQTVSTGTAEPIEYDTALVNEGFAETPLDANFSIELPYDGLYLVTARGQWASDGNNRRRFNFESNVTGSFADTSPVIQDHQHVGGTVTHVSQVVGGYQGTAGERLRSTAFQTSGSPLTLDSAEMLIVFMFPL